MQTKSGFKIRTLFTVIITTLQLLGPSNPHSFGLDIRQPITVNQIPDLQPASKFCFNANGSNLGTVTEVKIDSINIDSYNIQSDNYLTVCNYNVSIAEGKHLLSISGPINTINQDFYTFAYPTLTVGPSPLTGDKKGGSVVSMTGLRLHGTASVADSVFQYTPSLIFAGNTATLTLTPNTLSFTPPPVQQAQVAAFTVQINVSRSGGNNSWATILYQGQYTYTSGNSTTNISTVSPSLSATVSQTSKSTNCSITLNASGLNQINQYAGTATAFFGPYNNTFTVSMGTSYPNKQGQLTLSNSTLLRSIWGKYSGATIIVSLYDYAKGSSYTSVAKNQC